MKSRLPREELIKEYINLGLISERHLEFYHLPHEIKSNIEVFTKFCAENGGWRGIILSDDEICGNKELVKIAKKYDFFGEYHLLSDSILNDSEMAIVLANGNAREFRFFSKEIRSNINLMRKAIKINPNIYEVLPVCSKSDRQIILVVAEKEPWKLRSLLSTRKELRESIFCDKEIALLVAKKDPGLLYELFDETLFTKADILKEVFSVDDKTECKKRLLEYTWGIKYVDPKIWNTDINFVKKVLKEDGSVYEILPVEFKENRQLALMAVKSFPYILSDMPEIFRDDKDIVLFALQEDTDQMLEYASERLKADYDIVYRAVSVDALNLEFASEELRDNKNIVLRAVKTWGGAIEDASPRLQKDEDIIKVAEKNM